MEPILLHAWSPSYYTRGALKLGVGAEHPPPPRGAVAWTRQPPNIFSFFLDKSRKLFKIVSVLRSASVKRFDVSRMRDFKIYFDI